MAKLLLILFYPHCLIYDENLRDSLISPLVHLHSRNKFLNLRTLIFSRSRQSIFPGFGMSYSLYFSQHCLSYRTVFIQLNLCRCWYLKSLFVISPILLFSPVCQSLLSFFSHLFGIGITVVHIVVPKWGFSIRKLMKCSIFYQEINEMQIVLYGAVHDNPLSDRFFSIIFVINFLIARFWNRSDSCLQCHCLKAILTDKYFVNFIRMYNGLVLLPLFFAPTKMDFWNDMDDSDSNLDKAYYFYTS